MDNRRIVKALGYLNRIIEAGERGYAVAASNVNNRALKILFQTFAVQRARFKDELAAEIQRLGGHIHGRSSFLGIIHRGRIDIFAALTIGAENVEQVVLKEVMIGEQVALATYERILKKDMPADTRAIIQKQYEQMCWVVDQVRLMRGQNGKRMVVRLYDSRVEAERAIRSLREAGILEDEIEMENLDPEIELYKGKGSTILETIVSGAVGGTIWGTVTGILAVLGIFQLAGLSQDVVNPGSLQWTAVMSMLGLMAGGAFVGSMIGLFIGWGIASEDRYVNTYTLKNGQILMRATVAQALASTAWQTMHQIALESRSLRVNAHLV